MKANVAHWGEGTIVPTRCLFWWVLTSVRDVVEGGRCAVLFQFRPIVDFLYVQNARRRVTRVVSVSGVGENGGDVNWVVVINVCACRVVASAFGDSNQARVVLVVRCASGANYAHFNATKAGGIHSRVSRPNVRH